MTSPIPLRRRASSLSSPKEKSGNSRRRLILKCLILTIFICCWGQHVWAQSSAVNNLEQKVYEFNNAAKYDSSVQLIYKFLHQPHISNDDKSEGFIQLSYTYKRLFDYESVLKYLDSALYYGIKTQQGKSYFNNISAEKAFVLFAMNSVPLSERILFGFPRHSIHCDKTSITRSAGKEKDTSMASASRL